MVLRKKIQQDTNQALKSGDKPRLEILRYLQAQIQNEEIQVGRRELSNEEIMKIISNQIKKLEESLALFKKGGREDLVDHTRQQIEILTSYLPQQLSDEELEKEIEKIIQENPQISQPGPLIGLCIKALGGRADNTQIAALAKKKLG